MQDLNRVRYVTENYHNLQGLRWAIWGGLCLFVAAEDGDLLPTAFLLLVAIPIGLALFLWSSRYYSQNFGNVEAPDKAHIELLRTVVLLVTGLASFLIDRTLQPPIYVALLVLAGGLFVMHWQVGRPYRWHYLALALLVVVIALALTWITLPAGSPFLRPGVVLWATIGVTLVLSGIIDHMMLVRTLKPVE